LRDPLFLFKIVAKIVFAISGLIRFVMPDMANAIFPTHCDRLLFLSILTSVMAIGADVKSTVVVRYGCGTRTGEMFSLYLLTGTGTVLSPMLWTDSLRGDR
jgi:uncharacterized membrane protein